MRRVVGFEEIYDNENDRTTIEEKSEVYDERISFHLTYTAPKKPSNFMNIVTFELHEYSFTNFILFSSWSK